MSLGALSGALEQGLVYAVMALGVYITFRVLNFPDLTVDGSFPLGAAIAARLIYTGGDPVVATLVAPVLGFVAGATTGVLNTKLKISGLLAGILTMTALYSVNLRIMGRANIPLLRSATVLTTLTGLGVPGGCAALILFSVTALVAKLLLDAFLRTEFGLALRATGDNEVMIRSLGVNTDSMKIIGLGLSNALVALCGAMVAQYQGFADIGMGIGMVVAGLASVIIGGAIIAPSSTGLATFGVVAGSVIYRFAVFVALRLGFAPTDLKIVTAALVVIALSGPVIRRTLGMERRRALGHGKAEASSENVFARNH
ncbi:MAG TPA: ABC transporter permease [Firmicutes bacterium]|nr:ABC transporter permease [Bacillota bacterium]